MHLATCFAPAALSGLLWNLGFIGVTLALVPPWGLTVGGPCTQACLLVSCLWGVFYYKEVQGTFLAGALEDGFLKAPNRHRLKFCLMWANQDWVDVHPAKRGWSNTYRADPSKSPKLPELCRHRITDLVTLLE